MGRDEAITVAVAGICGRMGSEAAAALAADSRVSLRLGLERSGHPMVGKQIEYLAATGAVRVRVVEGAGADLSGVSVLVDFSCPEATASYAELCARTGTALVSGVTGLSEPQTRVLRDAARRVAVLHSPNMSAGVAVLAWLVEAAASRLPLAFDVEIVETHHRAKKDVPSGTAAMLAARAARVRAREGQVQVGRAAGFGTRVPGQVAVHSLRGGDVVGEHIVKFIGDGETLTISHTAHSRKAFAMGVPVAVKFVSTAGPGLFSMEDAIAWTGDTSEEER